MQAVSVVEGTSPVILAFPHVGTHVPPRIMDMLNENGRRLSDTDWHVDQLYGNVLPSATTVRANFHSYVVDANRDPSGKSLYPGQNTTGLCPSTDFDGVDIWKAGREPDEEETNTRRAAFHAPYHAALSTQIERIHNLHGCAILYDCHSIRSEISYLFDGKLPDFNIGTNHGSTCDALLEAHVVDVCAKTQGYSHILNGRFKGGWTTRHYAAPEKNIHVIQMELAQSTYMHERDPWPFDDDLAQKLRPVLTEILLGLDNIAREKLLK
jgi:N-formylglutamate deformylase